jgi:hypothetical protein
VKLSRSNSKWARKIEEPSAVRAAAISTSRLSVQHPTHLIEVRTKDSEIISQKSCERLTICRLEAYSCCS